MQSGLKARIARLHDDYFDAIGSEIVITKQDKVIDKSKSSRNCSKVIRVVIRL